MKVLLYCVYLQRKVFFAGILILIFHSWQISSIEILFIIKTLQISQWRLTGMDLKKSWVRFNKKVAYPELESV